MPLCCSIVLLAHDGYDNITIAERHDTGRIQVARWREHFAGAGLAAIEKDMIYAPSRCELPGGRTAP